MSRLIKATPNICAMCRYRSNISSEFGNCEYQAITGHSRIFENGKLAYDPEYCDKFERGAKIRRSCRMSLPGSVKNGEWPLGFNPWQE